MPRLPNKVLKICSGGYVAAVSFMRALINDLRVWAMLAYYAMCCRSYLENSGSNYCAVHVLCLL